MIFSSFFFRIDTCTKVIPHTYTSDLAASAALVFALAPLLLLWISDNISKRYFL